MATVVASSSPAFSSTTQSRHFLAPYRPVPHSQHNAYDAFASHAHGHGHGQKHAPSIASTSASWRMRAPAQPTLASAPTPAPAPVRIRNPAHARSHSASSDASWRSTSSSPSTPPTHDTHIPSSSRGAHTHFQRVPTSILVYTPTDLLRLASSPLVNTALPESTHISSTTSSRITSGNARVELLGRAGVEDMRVPSRIQARLIDSSEGLFIWGGLRGQR
ncbi:hypothetical protein EW146_g10209 [Bondarzewia mesenterica]|uniref:Uncharacterized protein n=1 Tax=Bondarzewia mesenterica TaxID=1095465 RepID=A0A4S4L454_9AGAM|nr:hypothetical protein EW146_g10209 [Bondarzewia mesenterica]